MTNRLAQETSPYLLQHAANPVDWYAWGEEALAASRARDKPILLSIGYSACHWCHVMAHESFEDTGVAALMNEHFINIKVDREERPDLDHIYQTAQAMLTGRSGGWPLTMFLTPQQQPFFGGTYFPKQSRYNLPGFVELLPRVAAFYHEQKAEIERQGAALTEAFARSQNATPSAAEGEMDASPLAAAMRELQASCDTNYGGFGGAPKFPHPAELELCLRESARTGDDSFAQMALYSLARMAQGGIYDQIGGGFFRYSVDERWEIPHFEKMLYDNSQLLPLYVDAWQITGDPLFKQVAEETAAWVMREMQSPQGGYYATLDADSEHEEGKFYVWTPEELKQELEPSEYAVCSAYYGLDQSANFEGRWHLHVASDLSEVARATWLCTAGMRALACLCPRQIVGTARTKGATGARRKGTDRVERADDQGHGPCRTGAGSRRLAGFCTTGGGLHPQRIMARWAFARGQQGWPFQTECLSG